MAHQTTARDELPEATIARAAFWLSLACVLPAVPLLFVHDAPDWVVVSALSFALPAALAALASGAEYIVRRRAS